MSQSDHANQSSSPLDAFSWHVGSWYAGTWAAVSSRLSASVLLAVPLAVLVTAITLSLTACSKPSTGSADTKQSDPSSDEVLTILAGSELKDIEPFLPDIEQHTGIQLQLEYIGTLDGVDAIRQGKSVDAAWFSHGKYLSLVNQDKIKAQSPIMLSPVVMGVKHSRATALDWIDAQGKPNPDISWQSIAEASKSGKLRYAMTNPAASNSGFTALMGVASALAGTSDAPTSEEIAKVKPQLKDFFFGQALTSGSSGWLAEAYVKEQNKPQGEYALDAMINYESVLMQLNGSGQLSEPLTLIYPKEGIVTADYPLMLLNFDKKPAYEKVVDYLRSPEMQQKLMRQTSRRPVNTSVALDQSFYSGLLVELPFPNSQQVIDSLLLDFANELRNPTYALFLLDVSGSMQGEGINQLKDAMLALTERTATNSSQQFSQFADNEVVGLKPFDNTTYELHAYFISDQTRPKLVSDIQSLQPRGGTAIYSALKNGYETMQKIKAANDADQHSNPTHTPYYYSIVLMTDGQNVDGIDFATFQHQYQQLPADIQNIKTFTVLFGDADPQQMQQIADLTGGRVFDGRDGNLSAVFRQIRGYQ